MNFDKGLKRNADGYYSYVGLSSDDFKRACALNKMIRDAKVEEATKESKRVAKACNFAIGCLCGLIAQLVAIATFACVWFF